MQRNTYAHMKFPHKNINFNNLITVQSTQNKIIFCIPDLLLLFQQIFILSALNYKALIYAFVCVYKRDRQADRDREKASNSKICRSQNIKVIILFHQKQRLFSCPFSTDLQISVSRFTTSIENKTNSCVSFSMVFTQKPMPPTEGEIQNQHWSFSLLFLVDINLSYQFICQCEWEGADQFC